MVAWRQGSIAHVTSGGRCRPARRQKQICAQGGSRGRAPCALASEALTRPTRPGGAERGRDVRGSKSLSANSSHLPRYFIASARGVLRGTLRR